MTLRNLQEWCTRRAFCSTEQSEICTTGAPDELSVLPNDLKFARLVYSTSYWFLITTQKFARKSTRAKFFHHLRGHCAVGESVHFRQLIGRPFPFLEFLPLMLMSTAVCPFSSCSCMASSISSVTSKPFCCIHSLLPISTLYLVGSLAALLPSFAWLSAVEGEQFSNHDIFTKEIITQCFRNDTYPSG